jgi:hypothetical protein
MQIMPLNIFWSKYLRDVDECIGLFLPYAYPVYYLFPYSLRGSLVYGVLTKLCVEDVLKSSEIKLEYLGL